MPIKLDRRDVLAVAERRFNQRNKWKIIVFGVGFVILFIIYSLLSVVFKSRVFDWILGFFLLLTFVSSLISWGRALGKAEKTLVEEWKKDA